MEEIKINMDGLLDELNEKFIDTSSISVYFGIITITRRSLEKLKASNKKANIKMAGMLIFSKNVTPELARDTIASVKVRGIVRATMEIKEVLRTL